VSRPLSDRSSPEGPSGKAFLFFRPNGKILLPTAGSRRLLWVKKISKIGHLQMDSVHPLLGMDIALQELGVLGIAR
jgi:hypothetical protein